jgi:hypothetical protein
MIIGIASENTVLIMERYTEEEEHLQNHFAAIQECFHRIGRAITISASRPSLDFRRSFLRDPPSSTTLVSTLIAVRFSL